MTLFTPFPFAAGQVTFAPSTVRRHVMPNKISRLPQEHQLGNRKRVLLVGAEPFAQDSISTLLSTMGWTCTAVPDLEDVLPAIHQCSFDTVLLNLRDSGAGVERTLLGIKEIQPSLSERIVVISSAAADSEVLELIERYDLSHLPQEKVLSRLWSTLEDLVVFPSWSRVASRNVRIARMLFDSFCVPLPAGVRNTHTSGRHFTYEHNSTMIDVLVDVQPGSNRISLMGQVLDATRSQARNENLAVVLSAQTGTLARTRTNRLGEFNLQFEFAENVNLEIRIGERSWISIPLTEMDWAKERMPNGKKRP
jgi:CheY-like chemotaxis protein